MRISITKYVFVVLLFIFSIMAQSCKVYQNSTTSLERIINTTDTRFKKIKTVKRKTYHLRRIEIRDGKLYGSKHKVGEMLLLNFMVEDIVSIRAQHKSASIGATVIVAVGAGLAIALAIYLMTFSISL